MFIKRRRLLVSIAALPAVALAQTARPPQEGKDFRAVTPSQPGESGNKIEVLEFFQYSCPHCMSYDPVLQGWKKTLPSDVEYRRIPISWDDKSVPHVRIYYTLEALGKTNELHSKVFEAIQTKRMPLLKPDEIADFMATQGIDRKQWLDAYNSFSVGARTSRAGQVWRAYKIDGTPAMAVHGRYTVGASEGMLEIVNNLVAAVRKNKP